MSCEICLKWGRDKNSVWVQGNQTFHTNALQYHDVKSKQHKQALSSKVDSLNLKKLEEKLSDNADLQVIKLMQISYFLARENIALSKYETLLDLCSDIGVELNLGTYKSRYACNEMLRTLSDFIEEEKIKTIKNAECFSIMIDEATDVNMKANLIVYACVWDRTLCAPKKFFLKVLPLTRRDALGIHKTLSEYLLNKDVDVTNLMGISTDGASVMIGAENGVCSLFKKTNPFLISTHCIAHRLSLASNDAFKEYTSLLEVETTLRSIYKFFKYSTNNITTLEQIETIVKEPLIRPKKVQDTRWIYIHRCIHAVKSSFKSLVLFFRGQAVQDKDVVAQALHDKLIDCAFLQKFLFLEKVMEILNSLILNFQRANVNFGLVESQLTAVLEQLTLLRNEDEIQSVFVTTLIANDFEIKLRPLGVSDKISFQKTKSEFLKSICTNIRERFRHRDMISAFGLLNIERYRLLDPKSANYKIELEKFGQEDIQKFAIHYGKCRKSEKGAIFKSWVHEAGLLNEWPQVKRIIMDRYLNLDSEQVWRNFTIEMQDLYPNFSKLIRTLLIVPFSTVDCERGFSQFNLIKTRLRNRLTPVNMDILMRLSVEEKELVEVDFQRALTFWHKKERRPNSSK
jgi:hypothetical protein